MATAWTESKLSALWGSAKTNHLLAAGTLRPYHVGADGRRYFTQEAVMAHYAYKAADAPGVACCSCCGHCEEPRGFGTAKSFGPGGMAVDGDVPEYLKGYSPDEGPEPEPDDEDFNEPDDGEPDEDDLEELSEESLADYHDARLAELDAVEKLAEAVDALAFENALTALQTERLKFKQAMWRVFG
jgi:hypothetical protein